MGKLRFFIDFGSTFTKLVAFDMEREELAARVQVPSTVDTDVTIGLDAAFAAMAEQVDVQPEDRAAALACSSAAGGLKMLCIGMVPDYTTQAGRLAALGAGAKVLGTYSYELSRAEIKEICALRPDIILLTGGTDGGNSSVIVHNARMLAAYPDCAAHIIVAGNSKAQPQVREAFQVSGHRVYFTENVMPELGETNLAPVNRLIREIFLRHITEAKGIAAVNQRIRGVIMPTPAAVFEAAKLLSYGVPGTAYGLGELLLVDVGGATTDVYSIADGRPSRDGIELVGLREPTDKRTVEGDIGLYYNLDTLVGLAAQRNSAEAQSTDSAEALRKNLSVPAGQSQRELQLELTRLAVRTAVDRHVGVLETEYTPHGMAHRQRGKDLSEVKTVIGAGGPISFSSDPRRVLSGVIAEKDRPQLLKPKAPRLMIDSRYILFAIGLLAGEEPAPAYRIAEKYLVDCP